VQRNWQLVQSDDRYHVLSPGSGRLACDRVGTGRLAEPPEILAHLESLLHTSRRDLLGQRVLISAGGTREFLDPVRFMGNPSTGKMGMALARAALHRGASVTLVHAPMELLEGVDRIPVESAAEMQKAMVENFSEADLIIMAAAVADVRPATYSTTKLPKRSLPTQLDLAPVPDIVAELSLLKQPHQKLVGFAAQTGDIVTPALEKLQRKGLDAIVANPIDQPDSGFGGDRNQAIFIDSQGRQRTIAPCTKLEMAHQIFDFLGVIR
jgi:phosphopantothenoylcysteine decarboxylase / phosphopantothenate---cysteine ligase